MYFAQFNTGVTNAIRGHSLPSAKVCVPVIGSAVVDIDKFHFPCINSFVQKNITSATRTSETTNWVNVFRDPKIRIRWRRVLSFLCLFRLKLNPRDTTDCSVLRSEERR